MEFIVVPGLNQSSGHFSVSAHCQAAIRGRTLIVPCGWDQRNVFLKFYSQSQYFAAKGNAKAPKKVAQVECLLRGYLLPCIGKPRRLVAGFKEGRKDKFIEKSMKPRIKSDGLGWLQTEKLWIPCRVLQHGRLQILRQVQILPHGLTVVKEGEGIECFCFELAKCRGLCNGDGFNVGDLLSL